jgi:hypothetical protein
MARSIERFGERGMPWVMVKERYFSVMAVFRFGFAFNCIRFEANRFRLQAAGTAARGCDSEQVVPIGAAFPPMKRSRTS